MIKTNLIKAIKSNDIIATVLRNELQAHITTNDDIIKLVKDGLNTEAVFNYRRLNNCTITEAHKTIQNFKLLLKNSK